MASLLPKLERSSSSTQECQGRRGAAFERAEGMHAALGNAARGRWANDSRELSYHIGDTVDAFLADSEPAACPDSCLGFLASLLNPRPCIGGAIKDFKSQALNLADRYNRADGLVPAATSARPLVPLQKEAEELVGIGRGRDRLIRSLTDGGDASKQ